MTGTPLETPTVTWTVIETDGTEGPAHPTREDAMRALLTEPGTYIRMPLDVTAGEYVVTSVDPRPGGDSVDTGRRVTISVASLLGGREPDTDDEFGRQILPTPVAVMTPAETCVAIGQLRAEVAAYREWAGDQMTNGCTPGCYGARGHDTCGECTRRQT